jgi:vitamin B12 transporter
MKNSFRARGFAPALSVLSLAVAASLHAQTIELDPVVVSATRIEQKLSDVIPSASVITRDEIERSQAPTLIDLIQGQPGVEIGRNGGPGTVASIFMRGQDSKNVAVFIDGIPIQRDAFGNLKFVDIPPSQIEKIEILRGNMGAVYGESAVGGAIHIFTRSGTGKSGPNASAAYGSRNTSDLTAGYNLYGDDYKLGFSVQKFNTDGFSAMNSSQSALVNPDKDGLVRESVFLNGEKRIKQELAIGFQANSIDSKVEYDGTHDSSVLHNSKQKSSDLTVYSRMKLSSDWSSRLAMTQSDFKNREFRNVGTPSGSFEGDQLSIQWGNIYNLGAGKANFGVDLINSEFKTPTTYERDSLGYYLGYSGRFERLDYQANVRRDEIKSHEGITFKDKASNTWLLGAGYLISDNFKLTSLISTSFRAPTVGELYNGPWTTGNPNLNPEEHKGIEVGFNYDTGFGVFKINHFNTKTFNSIAYVSSGLTNYENIDKIENKGFEVSLNGNAAGWGYKLSAVAQDPKNAESGARLARRAKEYGSIGLTKTSIGIDWGTDLVWSGNRKDSDYTNKFNSSYTVFNLTAAKKLSPEWIGQVKLENAFDERYQLAHGYNTPPRGVFVTLQYKPK